MDKHPLNLALRFGLELAAVYGVGQWAWDQADTSILNWTYLILAITMFMTIWAVFNVPGDPSRSGKAPVVVRGWVRLAIELALFGLAVWALISNGKESFGWTLGILLVIHYAISFARIKWLLER